MKLGMEKKKAIIVGHEATGEFYSLELNHQNKLFDSYIDADKYLVKH